MILRPLLLALALAGCAQAQAPEPAGARAFLEGLYARYGTDDGFCPTCEAAPEVFDPALVALIQEDGRLTPEGEIGALGFDPLCQCQDDAGLKASIVSIAPTGPAAARATVSLAFEGQRATPPVTLALVRAGGQWRIHDVAAREMPSLAAYLAAENKRR